MTPPQPSPQLAGDEFCAYLAVTKHMGQAVEALDQLQSGIGRSDPALGAYLHAFVQQVAGQTLDCLQGWPT